MSMKHSLYYVYTLSTPNEAPFNGQVFFVGKGKGDIIHQHTTNRALTTLTPKSNIINSVLIRGMQIVKTKVFESYNKAEVYEQYTRVVSSLVDQGIPLTNVPHSNRGLSPTTVKVMLNHDEQARDYYENTKTRVANEMIRKFCLLDDDYDPREDPDSKYFVPTFVSWETITQENDLD